jgi:queuine tRNA-ribosyltransferase
VKSGEMLGSMLVSYANVQFYQELMAHARQAIADKTFAAFAEDVAQRYACSEAD